SINPSSKSTISGPLVFGLQLKTVQKVRESYNKSRQVKPANQCTEMTLEKRARVLSSKLLLIINNQASQVYHPEDKLTLKTLEFLVNEYDFHFHIKFGSDDKIKTKRKL
ncbi:20251_t:CDS:1, partial [Gigaspora rosea]